MPVDPHINPESGVWDDNYYAQTGRFLPGGDAYRGGGGGAQLDVSSVPSALGYAKELGAGEETALQNIVAAMKGREKPLDIYGRLEEEAGIPALRTTSKTLSKEIANIEDYLDQIEPDISATTRESLVTEAQRRRMVETGREPYLEKLTKLGTSLGRIRGGLSEALAGVGTKVGLAMEGQRMDIEPQQMVYTAMVDRNARLMSGFTVDRQSRLDVLFANWERTNQLSDQEREEALELAGEERQYRRSLETAAAESGVKLTGDEDIDEMLSLIGGAAAEQIQFERRKAGKATAGEKKQEATRELLNAAQRGATLQNLQSEFGDRLSTSEIVNLYTGASPYGEPEEPYARKVLGLKEPTATKYDEVKATVDQLKDVNATERDIKTYIESEGLSPSAFGYEEKKGWWPFGR